MYQNQSPFIYFPKKKNIKRFNVENKITSFKLKKQKANDKTIIRLKRMLSNQSSTNQKQMKKNDYSQQNKLLGGGCAASSMPIASPTKKKKKSIEKRINQKEKYQLNSLFKQKYEYWSNFKNVEEHIQNEDQIGMMHLIFKECVYELKDIIVYKIQLYKSKIFELLEIYLIYDFTGQALEDKVQQDVINKLGKIILKTKEQFQQEINQQPCLDLIFFLDVLSQLNTTRVGKDESSKSLFIKVKETVQLVIKRGIGISYAFTGDIQKSLSSVIDSTSDAIAFYQKMKANTLQQQLIKIWLKKAQQFEQNLFNIPVEDELEFHIKLFNDFSKEDTSNEVLLIILIRINCLLEKAIYLPESNQKNEYQIKSMETRFPLSTPIMKEFINKLIQKISDKSKLEIIPFFAFAVSNPTFRFLAVNILLQYRIILNQTNDPKEEKEVIYIHLCSQYLSEKLQSIKLLFEFYQEFIDYFNDNVNNIDFKNKIIKNSQIRSKTLQDQKINISDYEESLNNNEDIHKLVVKNLIEKWEREVRQRQNDKISQKDDILLEVSDLYVHQSIKHQTGLQLQVSQQKDQTAIQYIIESFLKPNYIIQQDQNDNHLNKNQVNKNIDSKERSNQCKIIAILGEGGTGKSMFLKKLETLLIENLNNNNQDFEKANYIPLLIKCNSLDIISPSIEEYLQQQGIKLNQINMLKESSRNKLILLDGYDEYPGEYFRIFYKLNIKNWKNTLVIVTSRKEGFSLNDASTYFSQDNDKDQRDESSYSILKLQEFNKEDIQKYCQKYFKQLQVNQNKEDDDDYNKNMELMNNFLNNQQIEQLLYLPINLFLFTRMIVNLKEDKEKEILKSNITDQIEIQEIFFNEQFNREAQEFIQTQFKDEETIKDQHLKKLIQQSYYEYFQAISMQMFQNKGISNKQNFLQIEKKQIKFELGDEIKQKLSKQNQVKLIENIASYVNSKIITRVKKINQSNYDYQNENDTDVSQFVSKKKLFFEFKHKSLFEYFVARAMKYDFDKHGDNLYKLPLNELKQFNINKKSIMNPGLNQSEYQTLVKLYKLIKNDIDTEDFRENYFNENIEETNRYIQYIKSSKIQTIYEISDIDIGSSNLISALFLSNYSFPKLSISLCSFSKAYLPSKKDIKLSIDRCNLSQAFLQGSNLNIESSNTINANFDSFQKIFDNYNIFSFNSIICGKSNNIYTITETGYLNSYQFTNKQFKQLKSKHISNSALHQIQVLDSYILVSSIHTLFKIDANSLNIQDTYKFLLKITSITTINNNIIISLEDNTNYFGNLEIGFRKIQIIGQQCIFCDNQQFIISLLQQEVKIWDYQKNFELIHTIKQNRQINSISCSPDGKYLVTGGNDSNLQIWDLKQNFQLVQEINSIDANTGILKFSPNGKLLARSSRNKNCRLFNVSNQFEMCKDIIQHPDQIISIDFTLDNEYLITCSSDFTSKVQNLLNPSDIIINPIQTQSSIFSVAYSKNSKYFATGSLDGTCEIWSTEDNFQLIKKIKEHHSQLIASIAFSYDGKYFATSSFDNTFIIWDVQKKFDLILKVNAHSDQINSICFSQNNKYFVTGSTDNSLKIWNPQSNYQLIKEIKNHTSSINQVDFSPNSQLLVSASSDCSCKIWDVENDFQIIKSIQEESGDITTVSFGSNGRYLAIGSSNKTCKIWKINNNNFSLIHTIQVHTLKITSVAFSSDGKYLATGSEDTTCKLWSVERNFELINTIQGHTGQINQITFSEDCKQIATCATDKKFCIWNIEQGYDYTNNIHSLQSQTKHVAFSADSKLLATGYMDKTCTIWSTQKDFEPVQILDGFKNQISAIAFSKNNKFLAIADKSQCKIWSFVSGFKLLNTQINHENKIIGAFFSYDNKYLATICSKQCKIWNVQNEFQIAYTLQGIQQQQQKNQIQYTSLCFSTCDYFCVSLSDGNFIVWNAKNKFEQIKKVQGHMEPINSIAFSPDSKYFATGSNDHICKIWNIENNFELFHQIQDHNGLISQVLFISDGKFLLTCSNDFTCKLYSTQLNFKFVITIKSYNQIVSSVSFSSDGKYLASGLSDDSCKIWDTDKGFSLMKAIKQETSADSVLVANSIDGKFLALVSQKNVCRIWKISRGVQHVQQISVDCQQIDTAQFSNDNKYIGIQSEDKNWKVYDLQQFKMINQFKQQDYEKMCNTYKINWQLKHRQYEMSLLESNYIL